MQIISKSLFWFINTTTCLILLVFILGSSIWLVMSHQGRQEAELIHQAEILVKEKIKFQPTDVFAGCVHPNNEIIISVNHEIFFGVRDKKVFIPKLTPWYNDKAKAMASDLAVEDHGEDVYYLMEYCK